MLSARVSPENTEFSESRCLQPILPVVFFASLWR
jgi:hypothetical protein